MEAQVALKILGHLKNIIYNKNKYLNKQIMLATLYTTNTKVFQFLITQQPT